MAAVDARAGQQGRGARRARGSARRRARSPPRPAATRAEHRLPLGPRATTSRTRRPPRSRPACTCSASPTASALDRSRRALKRRAIERDLLFMGADCGTAIIDGVALGFANAVERGPVGIVGASGTGTQEVSCLLDAAGIGVSHAIGVGGRDLHADVGGTMMRRGLELLAQGRRHRGDRGDLQAARSGRRHGDRGGGRARPASPWSSASGSTLEEAAARAAELVGGVGARFQERLTSARPPRARPAGCTAAARCAARRRGSSARARSSTSATTSYTAGSGAPDDRPGAAHRAPRAASAPTRVAGRCSTSCSATAPTPTRPASSRRSIARRARTRSVVVALCGAAADPQGLDGQRGAAGSGRRGRHAAQRARRPELARAGGGWLTLLGRPLVVANAGVDLFADELERQGVRVERVDGARRPTAPRTRSRACALDAAAIARANDEAVAADRRPRSRCSSASAWRATCSPAWRPARSCTPARRSTGPTCPARCAARSSARAVYEGLRRATARTPSAAPPPASSSSALPRARRGRADGGRRQRRRCRCAWSRTPTHGNRAFCTFNEGLGKVLRYGANDAEVLERLAWIRDVLARVFARRARRAASRSTCAR